MVGLQRSGVDCQWNGLNTSAKTDCLHTYLFNKFSTDPRRIFLCPQPGEKRSRCDMCWGSFYITDQEFEALVDDVMMCYEASR